MTFLVALNSRGTVFRCAKLKGKFVKLWSEIQGILLLTLHLYFSNKVIYLIKLLLLIEFLSTSCHSHPCCSRNFGLVNTIVQFT